MPGGPDEYELAACGLLITERDGTIRRANATLCAWTGFAASELVGKRFQDLLTIGSRLFHQTHWLPLLQMQGSVAEVQLEMKHRDGRVLAVLVNASQRREPPAGSPGSGLVDIALFIATDRRKYERELLGERRRAEELLASERQAQQARQVAEARLRLALESANLCVWSAELPSGARHYGREVAALIGATEIAEVSAEAYLACIHPEDREREATAFAAALDPAQRANHSVEYRLLGHDGGERIVRSTGRAFFSDDSTAVQFSGVLEDVTERRRAEEQLRERELAFRTLAENSPDVIARYDRERRYLYLNPMAARFTGRPVEWYLGKRLEEGTLASDAMALFVAGIDAALAGRTSRVDYSYTSPDGVQRAFQAHLVGERDAQGEIATVLAITRDVTMMRQQEREADQRAATAEELIGIVSHDLRNPLSAVLMGARLLGTMELGPQGKVAARITSAAERASRLITDLLDFTQAKLGGGLRVTPAEVDLHALVADSLEEVKLAWPGRMIDHRCSGEGLALADGDRLAQVVTNLANNALTYGAPDVPVTFTTSIGEQALEISVHNAGVPIPHEVQPHIFEPLRRGEQHVKLGSRSVGLGLYIVRAIAVAHGGQVSVRSEEGHGTTFLVSLPRR